MICNHGLTCLPHLLAFLHRSWQVDYLIEFASWLLVTNGTITSSPDNKEGDILPKATNNSSRAALAGGLGEAGPGRAAQEVLLEAAGILMDDDAAQGGWEFEHACWIHGSITGLRCRANNGFSREWTAAYFMGGKVLRRFWGEPLRRHIT